MTRTRTPFAGLLWFVIAAFLASCANPNEANKPIPISHTPVAVEGDLTFVALAASELGTCALTPSGAAYCWGELDGGVASTPTAVQGSLVFAAVSPHCGLTPGGEAHCWGWPALVPTPEPGDVRLSSLSSGGRTTCGLTAEGAAFCWFDFGVQGGRPRAPVRLTGGLVLAAIDVGGTDFVMEQVCGLTGEGAIYRWLMNGEPPAQVAGDHSLSSLSVGRAHGCGISGGTTYCWGSNYSGQLGTGTTAPSFSALRPVTTQQAFSSVATHYDHSCALNNDGVAYCWGINATGQLGYRSDQTCTTGEVTWPCATVPGPVATDLRFSAITTGRFHTCGLTSAGRAYCWGSRPLLGDRR